MLKQFLKPLVALTGLFLSPVAQAQPACNLGSLQGDYAFTAQGAVLGTIDAAKVVHPFPAPQPINTVAVVTFHGNGTLERLAFTVANGQPQVAQPPSDDGFLPIQTGTYSVSDECTGTMHLVIPGANNAHTTLDLALVLVDFGQRIFAVVSSEVVPVVGALAVNVSAEMTRNVPRRR
ncbi:MAG TPA: hypothetical protein VFL55_19105 [Acetobacteraceae bacterium]|nr:hypothetical protein [Acetobacteraceae bacterium]